MADAEAASRALTVTFAALHERYAQEWREALTPEDRERLWHRDRAVDDVKVELEKVVERGTFESA